MNKASVLIFMKRPYNFSQEQHFYTPTFLKWGHTGFALSFCHNSFSLNILRRNGQNLTKFSICIKIDKTLLGLLHVIFSKFVTELWPLMQDFHF